MSEKQKRIRKSTNEKQKRKQKPKNEQLKRKQKPKRKKQDNSPYLWGGVLIASVLLISLALTMFLAVADIGNKRMFEQTRAVIMTENSKVETWIAETATQGSIGQTATVDNLLTATAQANMNLHPHGTVEAISTPSQ